MNDFRADLHCHSTCSDGTYTPEELLHHAKEIGLSGLSITDHDTIDAYKTALPLSQEIGIPLISGIEFSSSLEGVSVHILGYAYDLNSPQILQLCEKHHRRRKDRNTIILDLLAKANLPITEEELMEQAKNQGGVYNVGRPHIAQAMVKRGYVRTVEEAFKKYLNDRKPYFIRGETVSTEETLDVIHQAKGLAVIAHPHLQQNTSILKKLFERDFDGIECYYARFLPDRHEPWLQIANKKGWLITGGSDFHGAVKPGIPLGCSWVPEETFRYLQKHFEGNQR